MIETPPLKTERFEVKPKVVDYSPNFSDVNNDLRRNPVLEDELNEIIDCLTTGQAVPDKYYRAGIGRTPDRLLAETGIKHLHLGSKDSDSLLYLVEYDEIVLLLQINGHIHFRTSPLGKLLDNVLARGISTISIKPDG